MIPAACSTRSESKAEERLFYALRDSLDDTHTIFHSFDLFKHNLNNRRICAAARQSRQTIDKSRTLRYR
jgi:hypothetical protein